MVSKVVLNFKIEFPEIVHFQLISKARNELNLSKDNHCLMIKNFLVDLHAKNITYLSCHNVNHVNTEFLHHDVSVDVTFHL